MRRAIRRANSWPELSSLGANSPAVRARRFDSSDPRHFVRCAFDTKATADAAVRTDRFAEQRQGDLVARPASVADRGSKEQTSTRRQRPVIDARGNAITVPHAQCLGTETRVYRVFSAFLDHISCLETSMDRSEPVVSCRASVQIMLCVDES